jgi:small-conductance mechanosensitive channel
MELFGIRFVGVNADNGWKLVLTIALIVLVFLVRKILRAITRVVLRGFENERARFWTHQGISLFAAVVLILGVLSIWFEDPARLTTALGLVTAGLAFALQKVVTSVAGYFVILRGTNFSVGDRITMGGVRGDVISLGFIQTTIMEMGQPPSVQPADPAVWVGSRQFTGRIVTVTNDKIFDEPVYNYTRDFPYIWEEIRIPISYEDDFEQAESILLEAAKGHAMDAGKLGEAHLRHMQLRYALDIKDLDVRVFYRLTDNWLELAVRFVVPAHGVRDIKDAISREVLRRFKGAGIGIASATFDIVGLPPVRLQLDDGVRRAAQDRG